MCLHNKVFNILNLNMWYDLDEFNEDDTILNFH
jgi:hypothetical protein